jgi:hypothetical protein
MEPYCFAYNVKNVGQIFPAANSLNLAIVYDAVFAARVPLYLFSALELSFFRSQLLRFTSHRALRSALTEYAFMIDVRNDGQRNLTNDNSIEACAVLVENLRTLLNKVSVFV